jgi:mono/diheme cytochrome c family protein
LTRRNRLLEWTILLTGLSLLLSACGALNLAGEPEIVSTIPPRPTQAPTEAAVLPQTPPNIAVGSEIFAENCTACHGLNGGGDGELVASGQVPSPGDFTDWDNVAVDTPVDWYNTVTNGNLANLMPPWIDSLSPSERWSVTMYNYTLHYTPDMLESGAVIYEQSCAACHGDTGLGDGPDAADLELTSLANPEIMLTLSDMDLYSVIADGLPDDDTHAFATDLSEDDLRAVTAHVRTLSLATDGDVGETAIPEPEGTEEAGAGVESAGAELDSEAEAAHSDAGVNAIELVENGTISGTITNGTEGGTLPEGTLIEVHVFNDNLEEIDVLETTLEGDSFAFEDTPIDPANTYVALMTHNERRFISEPTPGWGVNESTLNLPILIYEVTDDESVLSINTIAVQVTQMEDSLQVLQIVTYDNSSDRLYSQSENIAPEGEEPLFASVTVSLPPGSIVGGFDSNPRYQIDAETFTVTDTQPVLPGAGHTVQLAYFIPFERDAIIEHPLDYDMNGLFRLLARPATMEVTGDAIQAFGEVPIRDIIYAEYGGEYTLAKGDTLRYELERGREPRVAGEAGGIGNVGTLPIVLFVLSGASALTALGLFVYGRVQGDPKKKLDREIDELASQIAKLDNAHDSGSINHDVYQRQRAELKEKLRSLMEQKTGE